MKRSGFRRITLRLPLECFKTAERIALQRQLSLSSVVKEALARGLREDEQPQRSEATLQAYKEAFANFFRRIVAA
jgi:hypothetical protein